MKKLALTLAISCLALPSTAHAWGKTGHRVGGAIAQDYLSIDAKAGIGSILGAEGLAEASTWPDFMRSSPDSFWRREAGPWHYVTVPHSETYDDVGAPEEGDAVSALADFRKVLRDATSSPDEKALALRFAIHIIGDLHQPLHVGNGTDRGGNDFKATYFGELTNLHSIWDSRMIDREQLSYSEMANWLGRQITPELAEEWSNADPMVWVAESAAMRDTVYPEEGEDLRWSYTFKHKADLDLRLSQSGVRLATWLNKTFEDE